MLFGKHPRPLDIFIWTVLTARGYRQCACLDITSNKSNSTITSIEAGDVLYTETIEIAQALNTHFSRIGTKLAAKIKEKLRLIVSNSRKFFPPVIRDGTAIVFLL